MTPIIGMVMSILGLSELVHALRRVDSFATVIQALKAGQSGTIDGAWGSSCALTAAAVAEEAPGRC